MSTNGACRASGLPCCRRHDEDGKLAPTLEPLEVSSPRSATAVRLRHQRFHWSIMTPMKASKSSGRQLVELPARTR